MADNTTINASTVAGGAVFRDVDRAGIRTQVVTLDLGGAGAEALVAGSLPVTTPKSATATAPAQTAVGITAAQILAASARKRLMLVNTGTTVIKIALGAAPTQTAYHVALGAASAADNGSGGVYTDDDWIGSVHAVSSAAGGTLVIAELS